MFVLEIIGFGSWLWLGHRFVPIWVTVVVDGYVAMSC